MYPMADASNRRLGLDALKAAPPDLFGRSELGSSRVADRFLSFFFFVTIRNSALSGLLVDNDSIDTSDKNGSSCKLALIGKLLSARAPSVSTDEDFEEVV